MSCFHASVVITHQLFSWLSWPFPPSISMLFASCYWCSWRFGRLDGTRESLSVVVFRYPLPRCRCYPGSCQPYHLSLIQGRFPLQIQITFRQTTTHYFHCASSTSSPTRLEPLSAANYRLAVASLSARHCRIMRLLDLIRRSV